MIKLYGSRLGTALRNHWLLAEVGQEYEDIAVNMKEGEHKKPEFLALNPNGQVPVMVDGEFVLYESIAINDYLAEKFNSGLVGSNPQEKALVLQWSLWSSFHMQKLFGEMYMQKISGMNDEKAVENARNSLVKYFEILEKHLEGKEYLVGNQFTLAEINVNVAVSYAHFVDYDYSAYPNVTRWMKTTMERPSYLKAVSKENK